MTSDDAELLRLVIAKPGLSIRDYAQALDPQRYHHFRYVMLQLLHQRLVERFGNPHRARRWRALPTALHALGQVVLPVIDEEHLAWMQHWRKQRAARLARCRAEYQKRHRHEP